MLTFCIALNCAVRGFYVQVKEALPEPDTADCHSFKPGDFVSIKTRKGKNALQPRWSVPYQVLQLNNSHCCKMSRPSSMDSLLPLKKEPTELGIPRKTPK